MESLDERRAAFFGNPQAAPPPLAPFPPRSFRPANDVRWAREARAPHHARSRLLPSGAQLAGLRYEARVKEWLAEEFGPLFTSGPWWEYSNGGRRRYCQPDGTLRRGNQITLVEIKLRWTSDACFQLRDLYLPVARRIFPEASGFTLLAITRTFDPAVPVPAPVQLLGGIADTSPEGTIGVLRWRGDRQ